MAVCFTQWTVLPHDPVEKLADNLWRVEAPLGKSNRRVMSVARLRDGRLVVHNAIALDDAEMKELDAWGEVAAILVPNRFHRQDCRIWKDRYPKARVFCPASARGAVSKAVAVDGSYADAPGDEAVRVRHLAGLGEREGVVEVQSSDGLGLVFCDTILNMPAMGGAFGFLLHPTGTASVPRFTRWVFAKDLAALRADLHALAARGPVRLIPGHGRVVADGAAAALEAAAARLA
jgi:hypothetical protein